MGLIGDLDAGAVALDTAAFIYFIEDHPRFAPLIAPLFSEAADGKRELITSAMTLLEVLVVPYRAGNRPLAERYEALLTRSRGVRMMDVTRDVLRAAAWLRSTTGARTPDALQIATALGAGCKTFVTNDRRLPSLPGLNVIQLASYAA